MSLEALAGVKRARSAESDDSVDIATEPPSLVLPPTVDSSIVFQKPVKKAGHAPLFAGASPEAAIYVEVDDVAPRAVAAWEQRFSAEMAKFAAKAAASGPPAEV